MIRTTVLQMPLNESCSVSEVVAPKDAPQWAHWLAEMGFLPGEPVKVLARAFPHGDPLVVRVGDSTFALHRAEAECIHVLRCPPKLS